MYEAKARLDWHLFIDCPACGMRNDLADGNHNEDGVFSTPIFNNKWEDLNGESVQCEHCDLEFTISKAEY